jgi:D-alanyl-D-alanine carboxypeptidase/D-alanyl-D-alanine-endopeptidase (penicillin-binding protein 4)
MKRTFLLVVTGWILAFCSPWAFAGLDQIVQQSGKDAVMGVVVKDATTDRIIYQHNADHLFIPASSLKVYTGAAALIMLGPTYRFDTSLMTDAKTIRGGTLMGNLYVVFSGDPTLTSPDIMDVMSVLKKKAVNHVQGNVILVYPSYTGEKYPPGAMVSDRLHPYGAAVTPVIIDQNAITFLINTTRPGQLARVGASDASHRIHLIRNALYTKRPGTRACGLSYHLDEQNQLSVQGCVAPSSAAYVERVPVGNPSAYAQDVVSMALAHWGVVVHGHILTGQAPASTMLLNVHQSEPLPKILAETLKPSNNVFANALYLKIGSVYWRQMATWQNSGLAIKQILEKYAGVPMKSAILVDGAGLSRMNRVTPMQTVTLLTNMQHKFMLSDDYISAFPVPGEKGTLKRWRLAPQVRQQNMHAKTGTMKGIVGLAGYLLSSNHHSIVFAIMTNSTSPQLAYSDHIPFASWKYRDLEGKICQYLMNNPM